MNNATTDSAIDRSKLVQLLVCGPAQPLRGVPQLRAPYKALVRAGYATEAPKGDDAYEYALTPAGLAYLDETRRPA